VGTALIEVALVAFGGVGLWGGPGWLRIMISISLTILQVFAWLVGWLRRRTLAGKLLFCSAIPVLFVLRGVFLATEHHSPGVLELHGSLPRVYQVPPTSTTTGSPMGVKTSHLPPAGKNAKLPE
jgi:hypothetical protein